MPLPKVPFLLGEEDVVPDQAVPDQRGEGALGTTISCLSPELKQQIFSPFFFFLEQSGKRVVLLPGESSAFRCAHASVGLDAQSVARGSSHRPDPLDGGVPGDRVGLG